MGWKLTWRAFSLSVDPIDYLDWNAIYVVAASGHFDALLLCQFSHILGQLDFSLVSAGITPNSLRLLQRFPLFSSSRFSERLSGRLASFFSDLVFAEDGPKTEKVAYAGPSRWWAGSPTSSLGPADPTLILAYGFSLWLNRWAKNHQTIV